MPADTASNFISVVHTLKQISVQEGDIVSGVQKRSSSEYFKKMKGMRP